MSETGKEDKIGREKELNAGKHARGRSRRQ